MSKPSKRRVGLGLASVEKENGRRHAVRFVDFFYTLNALCRGIPTEAYVFL
jgi:hypothetical protein